MNSLPGKHAVLSPSAAKRDLACTPAARLNQRYREKYGEQSSPAAEEGTTAHALAQFKLEKELGRISEYGFQELKKKLFSGQRPPQDMEDATDQYVELVMEKWFSVLKQDPDSVILIEQPVDLSDWVPHSFGTSDCIILSDARMEVLDYKHGRGIRVDAKENPQSRLYALGALTMFGELYSFPTVYMTIVQPRIYHITEESMSREDLLQWGTEYVIPRARLAWEGKGDFAPSKESCRFCLVRGFCYARFLQAIQPLQEGIRAPETLEEKDLPRILEVADNATAFFKDVKEYALRIAKDGERISGYKLVSGKNKPRRWADEEALKEKLSKAGISPEKWSERKLFGVPKMEKSLDKKEFDALCASSVQRNDPDLELVPTTDTRPEYGLLSDNEIDDLLKESNV